MIEIVEFIKRDRPEAARKLGRTFLTEAVRLRNNPRKGRLVPQLVEKGLSDYRQVVVSNYRLIYAIRTEYVDVVAVIDARRDFQTALFQRLIR